MRPVRKHFVFILEVLKYVWNVTGPAHPEIRLLPITVLSLKTLFHAPGMSSTTPPLPYQPPPDREEHLCTACLVFSDPFGLGTQSQVWAECVTCKETQGLVLVLSHSRVIGRLEKFTWIQAKLNLCLMEKWPFSFFSEGSLRDGMEKIFTAITGRESFTPCSFSPRFPLLPEVAAFLVDTKINLFLKIKSRKVTLSPWIHPAAPD